MKRLPQMVLLFLASTVLFSCNTAKYTVTDGVYYNPKKDKKELNYAMGYAEPEFTVVDNTNSGIEESARPNNVYKEIDTISYAGNNGTVINNNYYGDYYDYDNDEDDFRYTRRINNIYYPPTAPRVNYYSSWSRYGGNGFYCNTYYYDPWWGYDPWYGNSVSYRYGYSSYNYYNWNNCYSCGNTYNYYYNYGCGNIYNPCGGNNNNNGNWGNNNNSGGNRWTGPDYGPGPGPVNTLYARGTSPGNGLKRDLPERHEVRSGNSERLSPNGGGRAAELSSKEKPAFAGGNIKAPGKVLPNREKTVIKKDEVLVANHENGNSNSINEFKPKKDKDLPSREENNSYYTLKTSPNSTINPHGGAITKTTVVNGNTRTITKVNTRTIPGRSNSSAEINTTNVNTKTGRSFDNNGNYGSSRITRTTNTYRPRSNSTFTPSGSGTNVTPKQNSTRTKVSPRNTPSGTNVSPRTTPTRTNVSPRTTPSRTNVSPRTTPSRTNVSPRTTPTRTKSNNSYKPSGSSSSSSGGTSRSGTSRSSSSSSNSSSKSGSSKSLPKR
ncbi:MAG: hypothetical protein JXQ87_12570 [Bacteroidia bacterium]